MSDGNCIIAPQAIVGHVFISCLLAAACAGFLFIGALTDYAGYSGAIGIIGLIVLAGALGFYVLLEYDRKSVAGRVQ